MQFVFYTFLVLLLVCAAAIDYKYSSFKSQLVEHRENNLNNTTLIVLIPGAELPESAKNMIRPILDILGINTSNKVLFDELSNHLNTPETNIAVYNWGYGWRLDGHVYKNANRLEKFLRNRPEQEIILVGKSLGGLMAQKLMDEQPSFYKKAIYIAKPLTTNEALDHRNTAYLYSTGDHFLTLVSKWHPYFKEMDYNMLPNSIKLIAKASHSEITSYPEVIDFIHQHFKK